MDRSEYPFGGSASRPMAAAGGFLTDRLPPQNLEAERGVICSVVLDNGVLDEVVRILPTAEPFYRDTHHCLWGTILEMYRDNKPIGAISLKEELETKGRLRAAGGIEELGEIYDFVPGAADASYLAGIVRDKARARDLIDIASGMLRDAYSNNYSGEELLDAAQAKLFDVAEGDSRSRVRSVHEILPEVIRMIELRTETGEVTGLGSGWDDLDDLTGGFQPEQLIIIAGRPSIGKSCMGLNIADHVAFGLKCRVLYASLEMGARDLVSRLVGSRGRIDSYKIRTGHGIGYVEMAAMGRARHEMDFPLLWIDDSPSQSMLQIMAGARSLSRRGGLGAIVVDYVQLIEAESPRDPRQEQVAKISRRLKQLARELKVPVIALAQLNREVEKREDHRPRMADLKESGSLEQDADIVMLLHRPDYYDKDRVYQPVVESEVIVAKNRNGATGTVKLGLNLPCMRFEQWSSNAEPIGQDGRF